MSTKTSNSNYFGRDHAPLNLEVVRAEGSFLYDANGKEYIDFLAGWCVGNLGWRNEAIEKAIKNSDSPTYIYPSLLYKPWAELAELLAKITPGKLKKSFRTTGGSESIEAAMQIAMISTGRHKFLSIEGSYHGNTFGALSIGDSENRKTYPNLLPGCYKIDPPLDRKAAAKVETILKKKEIAAFIMEPVICNLGVEIPTQEFMETVRELCTKYGTLLVIDEVATGFGRTGKLFATEHFGIEPDIMCIAKALSGGHAGIGAAITTEEVARSVEGEFSLYSTYGWHPLSTDAAIANIQYWQQNKAAILKNVTEVSSLFWEKLSHMKFKNEAEVRIKGLAIGVNVATANYAKKLQEKCLKAGLLFNAEDTFLVFFPALTIEKDVAEKGLDILESCI
jgi:acetylornithine/succinyldiaminopimelate/putrescine aminotransferase